jgi:hypothetical protein
MSGLGVAVALAALALASPGAAMADAGTQYPDSHVSISMSRSARASSVVTVTFSGTNAVFTQGAPITYALDAFVQARSALPSCPASYGEELNNYANLGGRSIIKIATNLNEGVSGPFRFNVKYRSGPTRRIVVCAYSRLITDDAAHAQLRKTLRPPRR